jgi:hypothetical protein
MFATTALVAAGFSLHRVAAQAKARGSNGCGLAIDGISR